MKILCISHGRTLHGAERSFIEMLEALSIAGHELHAIFPANCVLIDLCKPYIKDYTIISQPWWSCNEARLPWREKIRVLKRIFIHTKESYRLIKNENPDLVITNTSVTICGAIASKIAQKKHFWYIREIGKVDLGLNFIFGKRLSLWLINKLSSKVLFNSFFLESSYKKYISKKKRNVIYQAVKSSTNNQFVQKHTTSNQLTLIIVGRFAEGKGQMVAVKAGHHLLRQDIEIKLLLVGAGSDTYSNQIRQYIKENELCPYIQLIDFVEDITEYYEQSDIALVCSRCEAFGRVTVESMKMGLPVVASDRGANSELIKDGFNGYLYEYENSEDLANKILLLREDKIREEIALQAKEWAHKVFNINNYSRKLNEIVRNA